MKLFNFFKNLLKYLVKPIGFAFIGIIFSLALVAGTYFGLAAIGYVSSSLGFLLSSAQPHYFADDYFFTGYTVIVLSALAFLFCRIVYASFKKVKEIWVNS